MHTPTGKRCSVHACPVRAFGTQSAIGILHDWVMRLVHRRVRDRSLACGCMGRSRLRQCATLRCDRRTREVECEAYERPAAARTHLRFNSFKRHTGPMRNTTSARQCTQCSAAFTSEGRPVLRSDRSLTVGAEDRPLRDVHLRSVRPETSTSAHRKRGPKEAGGCRRQTTRIRR